MRSRAAGAFVLTASLLFGAGAQAQSFVRPDCQGFVSVTASRFDTVVHGLWYRRYWTGSCDPQIPRCIPGSPNWNDMVGKLVARSASAHRPAALAKACRLGQLIGTEWSRSKLIRKIDLGDLRAFNHTLDQTDDVLKGIDQVEQAARAKLDAP
jgi:hypothetical protein